MDAINKIAIQNNLLVIEDAQSHGARFEVEDQNTLHNRGDVQAYSFILGKSWSIRRWRRNSY
jgi:dTDP-4-amino-4,6-dideoxygalactose transaminase